MFERIYKINNFKLNKFEDCINDDLSIDNLNPRFTLDKYGNLCINKDYYENEEELYLN